MVNPDIFYKKVINKLKNIENIQITKRYDIGKKYHFLDKVFLRVLERYPEKMPKIFFDMLDQRI